MHILIYIHTYILTYIHTIMQALKGNRDDAIRKRVTGEDDLTKKYLGRMKSMVCMLCTYVCMYVCVYI